MKVAKWEPLSGLRQAQDFCSDLLFIERQFRLLQSIRDLNLMGIKMLTLLWRAQEKEK